MGIGICRTCERAFERHGQAPYKYCEEHRLSRGDAKARDQRNLRLRRSSVRLPNRCLRCGDEFLAQRSDAKWCSVCRPQQNKSNLQRYEERNRHSCPSCGVEIARTSKLCKACGNRSAGEGRRGENSPQWKGGRRHDQYGYVHILVQSSGRTMRRYRPEHALVWEAANGLLPKGHIVHHLNHIKDDNRLENLEAMSKSSHNRQHGERRILELEAEIRRLKG